MRSHQVTWMTTTGRIRLVRATWRARFVLRANIRARRAQWRARCAPQALSATRDKTYAAPHAWPTSTTMRPPQSSRAFLAPRAQATPRRASPSTTARAAGALRRAGTTSTLSNRAIPSTPSPRTVGARTAQKGNCATRSAIPQQAARCRLARHAQLASIRVRGEIPVMATVRAQLAL